MVKRMKAPVLYPDEDKLLSSDPYITYRSYTGKEIGTQLTGAYNFQNISAALSIGRFFNVEPEKADEAVSGYVPENNRSQLIKKGDNTIILDAYNANPSSMIGAIDNLASFEGDLKMAILGDMYELGDETDRKHAEVGEYIRGMGFSEVIFCGEYMKQAHQTSPGSKYFPSKEELINYLHKNPVKHHIILIKASRSMGLEELLPTLAKL
jgi:UDP-N-acetylmuramoyl-tripeptide--D-alanyl-D-alanine ligase